MIGWKYIIHNSIKIAWARNIFVWFFIAWSLNSSELHKKQKDKGGLLFLFADPKGAFDSRVKSREQVWKIIADKKIYKGN